MAPDDHFDPENRLHTNAVKNKQLKAYVARCQHLPFRVTFHKPGHVQNPYQKQPHTSKTMSKDRKPVLNNRFKEKRRSNRLAKLVSEPGQSVMMQTMPGKVKVQVHNFRVDLKNFMAHLCYTGHVTSPNHPLGKASLKLEPVNTF
ncbi:hypothetical protein RUM44_002210 [Polyplax serrata]|uniref:Uncharacterized protein n=1 Tax=Polyplax serrata TaxID=468196 RepID=A0ABR1AMK6_POLSC